MSLVSATFRHGRRSLGGLVTRSMSSGGVSFELTEEQAAFQDIARKFAAEVMIPKAAEYDQSMEFPREVFDQAWELGLVNGHIPEEYGGLGLHTMEGVVIA